MKLERRFSKGAEVRAVPLPEADKLTIAGYAAVFNEDFVIYEDEDFRVTETITPGAFTSVMGDDVRCLFNHEPDHVLGRTGNGTLALMQDDKGLAFNNDMDTETRIGRDVYQFVKRGDVSGCSFAFIVAEDTWSDEERYGKIQVTRVITKMSQLFDVGPVTYPAYVQTSVDARTLREMRAIEDWSVGMPEAIVARIRAGKPARTLGETHPLYALHTTFITGA
jgi:uncharacterized protein